MELLSKRIKEMKPSATLAMSQKARELKSKGLDIIDLGVGEPDFNTPDFIKQALKEAIDANFSFYSPAGGYNDLKEAICHKLKRDNNLTYTPEQIVVSVGAKHALANVFQATINPGDEVLIPTPYWVTYPAQTELSGGKSVYIKTSIDHGFKVQPEELERAITPKTKALVFSSPSNPSGGVYRKEELEALAEVLEKYPNILVLSDEIYEYINFSSYGHASMAEIPSMFERTVVVNGVSKSYAMTGYRMGYMAAPEWLAKACTKLQGQQTTGICSVVQKACIEAINSDGTEVEKMRQAFAARRTLILSELHKMEGVETYEPEGAFYVFPDISSYFGKSDGETTVNSSSDMSLYLLEKAQISTVMGDAFGEPDCIRLSYATSEKLLTEAMKRMNNALQALIEQ